MSEPSTAPASPAARVPSQAVVTVVYGAHAEKLDHTFTSFARNPHLPLHAFVIGHQLPGQRLPGITYHLRAPDPAFSHPMRDADFRRWQFIDELDVDYALVVDGYDVLCLRELPSLAELLRGGWVGACVEHGGGRHLGGGLYTSNFVNAGVTFWNVRASRELRQEVLRRGRRSFRNLQDDQLALNEILHAQYFDRLTLLPCHYNYRASLGAGPWRWPRVPSLDGIRIYHNGHWVETARKLSGLEPFPRLPELPLDAGLLSPAKQRWRRWLCRWRKEGY